MSRILRRPMFRGGRVDSRGTGIASGLSYAKGGSVNTPKRGLVDGPGGYGGSIMSRGGLGGSGRTIGSGQGLTKGTRTARLLSQLRPLRSLATIPSLSTAGIMASPFLLPTSLAYLNRAKTDKGLQFMKDTDPSVFDETAMEGEMEVYSEGLKEANKQGNEISFMDNFFLDPETGTYPKWMGRTGDREKRQAIEEENVDDFTDYGQSAQINEGESALDAVMREAFAKKDNYNNQFRKTDDTEEPTEISKADLEERKELFADLLGSKKARGEDISNMLMSFAGKALKEGATTKSAFGDFFEEESKRPSSKTKVDQAAAQLAINDYIAGKRTKEQTQALIAQLNLKAKLGTADLYENITKIAGAGSVPSASVLESALKVTEDTRGKPIVRVKKAFKDDGSKNYTIDEKDYDSFIITESPKNIIYIDANGVDKIIY